MNLQSRGGFSVGDRVRMKENGREGVVTGIGEILMPVKGACDFSLTVKLDGNKSPTSRNAAFFEPAVTRDR